MPKVSVIIPCFNQGKYIDETLNSVLAQNYDDYEIVIVNDGSTDEFTNNLLRDYRRPKTRVIHTDNQGLSMARNTAIQAATGAYILPLDADDLIGREYLGKAVEILDGNRGIGIVTCLIEFFGAMNFQPVLPPFTAEAVLVRNDLPCSSFFRREDWERAGGFNPNMKAGWEDWDFWLTLLEFDLEVQRIPEVLFYYRIRKDSMLRSMVKEHRVQMYLQLYQNHQAYYQKHMRAVFSELCTFQEITGSRSYRLARYLERPSLVLEKMRNVLLQFTQGRRN